MSFCTQDLHIIYNVKEAAVQDAAACLFHIFYRKNKEFYVNSFPAEFNLRSPPDRLEKLSEKETLNMQLILT